MSSQIREDRNSYYDILEQTQKDEMDVTAWMVWFLQCLKKALLSTEDVLEKVLHKAAFWQQHQSTVLNERQKKILNKLLDGFEGNLTSARWWRMAPCSKETAVRDINDLIEKGILVKLNTGGRSTHYKLAE